MKVLLDESVDVEFRHALTGHDAYTVTYLRWNGLKNGALIARAAAGGFEVLITTDRGIPRQQNVAKLPLIVVVLHARSNQLVHLAPLSPQLLAALAMPPPLQKVIEIHP